MEKIIDENLSCKEIRIFAMSKQIASKLKSLDICKSYEIFIEWINQNSELLNLITPRGIYRDSYALIEFIKYKSVDEVKRYYERFGYTLALGYTFAMTDIHLENIVANRGSVRKMRIYNVKSIFRACK